jgi:DMSO/TMAO reductase YedYZ heme-binding membrane subunit
LAARNGVAVKPFPFRAFLSLASGLWTLMHIYLHIVLTLDILGAD